MDLESLRQEYESVPLDVVALAPHPMEQVKLWLAEWIEVAPNEPAAMIVTTAGVDGRPSARNVLLRAVDERGLVFYTSYESRKGRELAANPQAAALFSWVPVLRQILVSGAVVRTSAAESDRYWTTRPRGSQLAAWASEQSAVIPDRATLEERVAAAGERFAEGDVPRPEHWGGFRLVPDAVELWQGRPNRLHDRLLYRRPFGRDEGWEIVRLAP